MSEWQPIETAPLDWSPILVWAVSEGEREDADDEDRDPKPAPVVARHSRIQPGVWWAPSGMDRVYDPTHWMPLPEAPK